MITPIAVAVAEASGFSVPLCVATVMGGSMFGDNLSFISDTTIAACNGQGCAMKDKFRQNFWIAFPAAVVTVIVVSFYHGIQLLKEVFIHNYNLIQIIPYVLVLIGGIIGWNVFSCIVVGIISGSGNHVVDWGKTSFVDLVANMGNGVSGMFETCIVAVLVAALCALIRSSGGFDAL